MRLMLAETIQTLERLWEGGNWDGVGQLLLAGLLGALIGVEREYHGRAAGLRTHMLVCTGCCLVMLVSQSFAQRYSAVFPDSENVIRIDPARLAYSVMGGIGFMGAGAILKSGLTVRGLTTAACLWCAASIGLAVGSGLYLLSIATTIIVMVALMALTRVERIVSSHWYKTVTVTCKDVPEEMDAVKQILEHHAVKVLDVTFDRDLDAHSLEIAYNVRLKNRQLTTVIYQALADREGLHKIRVT